MTTRVARAAGRRPLGLRPVVTCEHASRAVPASARALLRGREGWLRTHRAWDPGALELARELARALGAPLVAARATRLVVDPNRSEANPAVLGPAARGADPALRERLLAALHRPFRARAWELVAAAAEGGTALHLSVHTFTPVRRGVRRDVDVGLLYDPRRAAERDLAGRWGRELAALEPRLRVRRNRPYRGDADGHTTALRRRLPERRYLGLELEVSQRFPRGPAARWRAVRASLRTSLLRTLGGDP